MTLPPLGIRIILSALVIVAAFWDIRTRRIPNWLTLTGLILGFALNMFLFERPLEGLLYSMKGFGLALGIYMVLYVLHAMGAGDVKLMAAVGATVGAANWFGIMLLTSVLGAVAGLALVMFKGRLRRTLVNVGIIVTSLGRGRAPYKQTPELDVSSDQGMRLPTPLPNFRITDLSQMKKIPKPFVAPGRRTPPTPAQSPNVIADPALVLVQQTPAPVGDPLAVLSLNDHPIPFTDKVAVPPGNVVQPAQESTGPAGAAGSTTAASTGNGTARGAAGGTGAANGNGTVNSNGKSSVGFGSGAALVGGSADGSVVAVVGGNGVNGGNGPGGNNGTAASGAGANGANGAGLGGIGVDGAGAGTGTGVGTGAGAGTGTGSGKIRRDRRRPLFVRRRGISMRWWCKRLLSINIRRAAGC